MDSMSIYGCDAEGNTLQLKIARKFRQTEVWIYLSLSNGTMYQLPGEKALYRARTRLICIIRLII
jgi:hypothetical protein